MDHAMFGDSLLLGVPAGWASAVLLVSLLSSIVLLAVCAVRVPAFSRRTVFSQPWMIACGIAGFASCCAIALSSWLGVPTLLYAGSVLLGIAMLAMNIGWGLVIVAQGAYKAFLGIAGAWALGLAINGLIQCLVPLAQAVATMVLPLISMALYAVNGTLQNKPLYRIDVAPGGETEKAQPLPSRVIRAAAASLVFCLAFGFMYGTVIFPTGSEASAVAFDALSTRGLAALLFFAVGVSPLRKYFPMLVAAFMLLVAAGVMLISVQLVTNSPQSYACQVVSLGYAAFDIAIWTLIASACSRAASPLNVRVIAVILAAQQTGILGGHACALALRQAGLSLDVTFLLIPLYLFLVACIVLIKLCADAWRSGALSFSRSMPGEGGGEGAPETGDADALEAFARRYDLTGREVEVLRFIREGRSVPYIAQTLVVSENTVKTHLRHVYTKCDVHNRQALLDLMAHSGKSDESAHA